MARRSKRVIGESKLRKKLKAMPDVITDGVRKAIATETRLAAEAIRNAVPRSSEGMPLDWQRRPRKHLQEAIKGSFSPKTLRGKVGILRKEDKETFFFAKFLEYGFRRRGRKINGKRMPPVGEKIEKHQFFWKTWRPMKNLAESHIIREVRTAFQKAINL